MTTLGVYTVVGNREYRGHPPGETFEAFIPSGPEQRAVDRGDIVLLRRVEPTLPARWALPDGWSSGHREE